MGTARRDRTGRRALALGAVLALCLATVLSPATTLAAMGSSAEPVAAPTSRVRDAGLIRPAAADDNIPGVPIPVSPVAGSLDDMADLDDVYEIYLDVGDRLQVYLWGDPGAVMDVTLFAPGATSVLSDYNDRTLMVGDYYTSVYPDPLGYTAVPFSEGGWGAGSYYLDVWVSSGSGTYDLFWEVIPANNQLYDVEVAGQDRVLTSVAVSQEAFPYGADTVIVSTGYNGPDALGAAPLARAV